MEQKYWEQFTKTGGVCDYLGYKMEVYSHGGGNKPDGEEEKQNGENVPVIRSYGQGT